MGPQGQMVRSSEKPMEVMPLKMPGPGPGPGLTGMLLAPPRDIE
jgi:hypothetical protein